MNIKEVKEMIALMNENDLTEIELERDGFKIRLRKGKQPESEQVFVHTSTPAAPASAQVGAPLAQEAQKPAGKYVSINAPMVGTFYRAPSPEAPAYAETGQTIEPGKIVCIIEAMKLMNEIKSEVKGKIIEVLVENGQPVEYGQELFRIEPI